MSASYCDVIVDREKNSKSVFYSALKGDNLLKASVGKHYKIIQWNIQDTVCPVKVGHIALLISLQVVQGAMEFRSGGLEPKVYFLLSLPNLPDLWCMGQEAG